MLPNLELFLHKIFAKHKIKCITNRTITPPDMQKNARSLQNIRRLRRPGQLLFIPSSRDPLRDISRIQRTGETTQLAAMRFCCRPRDDRLREPSSSEPIRREAEKDERDGCLHRAAVPPASLPRWLERQTFQIVSPFQRIGGTIPFDRKTP